MTIVYIPSGKSHTEEFTNMGDVIDAAEQFNHMEQKQYKTFEFCNMTPAEEEMVRCYLKMKLSIQSGVPVRHVLEGQPKPNEIYLAEIGHIKLR